MWEVHGKWQIEKKVFDIYFLLKSLYIWPSFVVYSSTIKIICVSIAFRRFHQLIILNICTNWSLGNFTKLETWRYKAIIVYIFAALYFLTLSVYKTLNLKKKYNFKTLFSAFFS